MVISPKGGIPKIWGETLLLLLLLGIDFSLSFEEVELISEKFASYKITQ
jgi:hypothetical protein